ncbi:MAG: PfkB family carbohydrate kinase [Rhizobiaceae bacterium]
MAADHERPGIAVIGGAVFDRKYRARAPLVAGTSNPADGSHSHGGVARNVAENLARLGVPVAFSSIVGEDETGSALTLHLETLGVDVTGMARTGERPTAEYAAILDTSNELALGIADMAIFDLYTKEHLDRAWANARAAEWVFADCNITAPILADLVSRCQSSGKRIAVNSVSTPKALKLRGLLALIDVLFTNRDEANAMLGGGNARDARAAAAGLLDAGVRAAVVTDGAAGYALADSGEVSWHDAAPASPVDITGAGDAFVAGALYRLAGGDGLAQAARAGALLAARTTETLASVVPDLSPAFFETAGDPLPAQG